MHLERPTRSANMVDVFERVLDKGIVIDAWLRLSVAGISLVAVEARVIVASIETYLKHTSVVGQLGSLAAPTAQPIEHSQTLPPIRSREPRTRPRR